MSCVDDAVQSDPLLPSHTQVLDHYENPRNVGALDKKKKYVVPLACPCVCLFLLCVARVDVVWQYVTASRRRAKSLMLPPTPHPHDQRAMIPIARGDVVSSHSIARRIAVAPFISSPIVRKQPVYRMVDLCCERQLACELAQHTPWSRWCL